MEMDVEMMVGENWGRYECRVIGGAVQQWVGGAVGDASGWCSGAY